jgi:ubiquinone/menaquinone biosynthesis C-methylase UbiE
MDYAETERVKYNRMWTEVPGYRNHSPGEALVSRFLKLAEPKPGETLIDIGAGTGRAALKLQEAGLAVTMFDISPSAPDNNAKGLPFIEGCVWRDFPGEFDWVYCTDVMEHLPTEHVDESLDTIARVARKGAYFQIALWQDGFGKRIGEVLHLTVKTSDWWEAKLGKRWDSVKCIESGDNRLIALCK